MMGKSDAGSLADILEMLGIHCTGNGLHPGGMTEDPGDGNGSFGNAVFVADLPKHLVQFGDLVMSCRRQ